MIHDNRATYACTRRGQVAGLQFSAFHARIHAIHVVIDADSSHSPEKPETRAHVPRVLPWSSSRAPRCVLVMALLIVFGVSSDTAIAPDLLQLEPHNSLQRVRVVGVRDGDTLVVEGATRKEIRVIGVDTPEMRPSAEEQRLWQRVWCVAETDVAPMAFEARGFVSRWLGNPTNRAPVEVEIEVPQLPPDGSIDVLGRLLAYVYRRGESGNVRQSLSGELLREGYSKAFLTDYRAAQGFPNISALYKAPWSILKRMAARAAADSGIATGHDTQQVGPVLQIRTTTGADRRRSLGPGRFERRCHRSRYEFRGA